MRKWRALAAGLVLTLCLGAVTACGNRDNNDKGTNTNTESTTNDKRPGNTNNVQTNTEDINNATNGTNGTNGNGAINEDRKSVV